MAGLYLLTDAECKAAKPKNKVTYLNDGGGLRLRIHPNGSKTWTQRARFAGKEKNLGLGSYPAVTLTIARSKAQTNRDLINQDKDPVIIKRTQRAALAQRSTESFGAIAREFFKHNEEEWSATHYKRNEGLLRRFLLPDLARLPIQEITEAYLFSVLKKAYDAGTKESVRRARALAAQIFRFGKDTQRCTNNPAKDLAENSYFKKPQVKHFTAIAEEDVPDLVHQLNLTGEAQRLQAETACLLKILLYTGQRVSATIACQWNEIDFEKSLWTIPAQRMKNRKTHVVPLPRQAIIALKQLRGMSIPHGDGFVFRSHSQSGHLSNNAPRLALHRLGFTVTAHGLRSLITDVLNEAGFNRDAVERQLDHVEQNQVRRAYLRTDFWTERAEMMQWFADWCERDHRPSNVIQFKTRSH